MQRDNAIDSVKGFAILLVMLGHCIVLNGLHETDTVLYDMIESVQMPLFMLVSGVLASMEVRTTGSGRGMQKLGARARAYLVPFFSWFLLVHLYVHAKAGTLSAAMFWKELKDLLFQTDRGLWFLMTLFVATVCGMIAQMIADKVMAKSSVKETEKRKCLKAVVFVCACACMYLLFFLQSRLGNTFLSPSLMVQYFPFYLLGYLANGYGSCVFAVIVPAQQIRVNMEKLVPVLVSAMFAGFVLMAVFFDLTAPVDGVVTLAIQMAASFLGTVSCYVGVGRTARRHQKKTEKRGFLSFAGLYTLEIYVLHFRFARLLGISEKGLQLYSFEGILWVVSAFVLMSILTAAGIMILQRIPLVSFLLFGKKHRSFFGKDNPSA